MARLHDVLAKDVAPGDRVVYLGNLLGIGGNGAAVIDEVLRFRRLMLMLPGAEPWDVVVLRGAQEEMWRKLLQLQFAVAPAEVLEWMLQQGLETTLAAYGGNIADARHAVRLGPLAITRWTGSLRDTMHAQDGHEAFMASLRRFAIDDAQQLLFVSAGIDPARPLDGQRDSFWWDEAGFDALSRPYGGFTCVVRGHDSKRRGVQIEPHRFSLDGGAGIGGNLAVVCLNPEGEILHRIEV